ncbi:hypothetical protein GCM10008020_29100 [Massilia psychrophila]|nr:hypothetical protein GCM10008020_29100 [Massilia psychrophila]
MSQERKDAVGNGSFTRLRLIAMRVWDAIRANVSSPRVRDRKLVDMTPVFDNDSSPRLLRHPPQDHRERHVIVLPKIFQQRAIREHD